jgi:universal stress protein A
MTSELNMNVKRILIATDFSESSNAALEFASSLANEAGARLYIAHVDEIADISVPAIPPFEGGYLFDAPWGCGRREMRDRLEAIIPTVTNVTFEHCYLTGLPVSQIVQLAEEKQIDLIVIGSHGRSGFSRLLMGSVAEGVMRGATCPVLVVKQVSAHAASEKTNVSTAISQQPDKSTKSVDVVGVLPEEIRVDPNITEGHPGYEESGNSEIRG